MTLPGTELLPEEWPHGWAEEFSAICDSNRGRLVRWLTAIFGPRDAEDIAQEALARLYVRPGLLDDDADPWPWLSVVARNVGRDMMRHNAFSTTVESGTLDLLPHEARVHDEVVARDDAERLRLALAGLSPRDRALIRLRDVQGVPVAEIAAALRMNDNAVRQQLFRARKRLANAYLDLGGDRLGVFGLLGLRCRELVRRYARAFDAVGPTATSMFRAASPAIAAILGGALVAGSVPPFGSARDPSAAKGPGLVSRPPVARLATAAGATGVAPGPRPTPSPFVEYDKDVANVHVRTRARDPLDNSPGEMERTKVDIEVPFGNGHITVETWDEHTGGHGPACLALKCPTAVPTPPPAGR